MVADASWTYVILVRWVHLICAALLIGGTFFLAWLLPAGTRATDPSSPADPGYVRSRRSFKIVTHACLLFILLSGAYNFYGNRVAYAETPTLAHSLFGSHALLGIVSLVLLVVLFARREPRRLERSWLRIAVLLLFLAVLFASSLKYVRDHTPAATVPSTQPGTTT